MRRDVPHTKLFLSLFSCKGTVSTETQEVYIYVRSNVIDMYSCSSLIQVHAHVSGGHSAAGMPSCMQPPSGTAMWSACSWTKERTSTQPTRYLPNPLCQNLNFPHILDAGIRIIRPLESLRAGRAGPTRDRALIYAQNRTERLPSSGRRKRATLRYLSSYKISHPANGSSFEPPAGVPPV